MLFASLASSSSNSKIRRAKPGMIVHAYNLSTQEDQARGLLQDRTNLGYIEVIRLAKAT